MALILARKIRQYRSIVSILQQQSSKREKSPRGFAHAIAALIAEEQFKERRTATHFPTGPALLVSFIRHHKAATKEEKNPPPPLSCVFVVGCASLPVCRQHRHRKKVPSFCSHPFALPSSRHEWCRGVCHSMLVVAYARQHLVVADAGGLHALLALLGDEGDSLTLLEGLEAVLLW
jgi:hypothetical protein